jgi:hypothetical protein
MTVLMKFNGRFSLSAHHRVIYLLSVVDYVKVGHHWSGNLTEGIKKPALHGRKVVQLGQTIYQPWLITRRIHITPLLGNRRSTIYFD